MLHQHMAKKVMHLDDPLKDDSNDRDLVWVRYTSQQELAVWIAIVLAKTFPMLEGSLTGKTGNNRKILIPERVEFYSGRTKIIFDVGEVLTNNIGVTNGVRFSFVDKRVVKS